jgi:outer membrane lipoprotein SlyB
MFENFDAELEEMKGHVEEAKWQLEMGIERFAHSIVGGVGGSVAGNYIGKEVVKQASSQVVGTLVGGVAGAIVGNVVTLGVQKLKEERIYKKLWDKNENTRVDFSIKKKFY